MNEQQRAVVHFCGAVLIGYLSGWLARHGAIASPYPTIILLSQFRGDSTL